MPKLSEIPRPWYSTIGPFSWYCPKGSSWYEFEWTVKNIQVVRVFWIPWCYITLTVLAKALNRSKYGKVSSIRVLGFSWHWSRYG